jgi:hypothetical protein
MFRIWDVGHHFRPNGSGNNPGDKIKTVEHVKDSVFVTTEHGNVWRWYIDDSGYPMTQKMNGSS